MEEQKYLKEKIQTLEKQQLQDLIYELVNKSEDCRKLILQWLGHIELLRKEEVDERINEKLLEEYWWNAEEIISEFNELGGPVEKEEETYEWLEEISELLKTDSLTSEARQGFIDEAMDEYRKHNSGFDDTLMELFFIS